MRIGIKYCGGCNPFYDRKAEVVKLQQGLKDISFEPLQHSGEYDRILLICGCQRACIRKLSDSGSRHLLVKSREDFIKVSELLKAEE